MNKSYSQLSTAIKGGDLKVVDLLGEHLQGIEERADLNAFVEVFKESALQKAWEVDEKIKSGKAGRLAGMMVAIKDNICYKDHIVTASSRILEGFTSLFSATVVERLLAEDAIIIGRLGCDEFAMGSSNENSFYGPVRNPRDSKLVPGGSSGGASAAVAAGLCHIAFGSDTGGSIRQPASFTGTIGMKPSYGRVSRHGLIAYASSFDQIGPIANSVEDVAMVMEVVSGRDDFDSTLSFEEVEKYSELNADTNKKRFVYFSSYVNHEGLDPEIRASFFKLIERLKNEGHQVEEREFHHLDQLVPTYYVLTTAEASSNLARYDGIRYGYRNKDSHDLRETYTKTRSEGFGLEVKRRIMLGTYVLSAGYYDAYYTKGQKVRRMVRDETLGHFENADFILSPSN